MKEIKVTLENESYPILVGKSILKKLNGEILKRGLFANIFVVADRNVLKYHRDKIQKALVSGKNKINFYTMAPGEESKSYIGLNKIYSSLLKHGYGRDTLLVSIGGGVAGDLAGFAASTYMRGIQLVHVPTTLLACVDSAVGGKTGINFDKKKNMIGTFYQPKFVLADIEFLSSLPAKEKISGIGEIIKYAYLADEEFYRFVSKNINKVYAGDNRVLEEVITRSASIKAAVVTQDEKESGPRKILNLGHTFAHAFETELNFRVKHGEAVIAGVICALFLSNKLGLLSGARAEALMELPLKVKLPNIFLKMNKENLYGIMLSDKKNRNGKIKFVLVEDIGSIVLDAESVKSDVFYAVDRMQELLSLQ